jgi:hypothetical protein
VNVLSPPKVVFLGMITRFPVAGAVWGTVQYLIGLRRLGYDVYYVEAHGRNPTMLMQGPGEDATARAVECVAGVMRRFDLADRWAFHALHDDGGCHGMSEGRLRELYANAALIINYHGGTEPRPEHAATGRLIYLETDPVLKLVRLAEGAEEVEDFLAPHAAFFTWGLNYGRPDCGVPLPERFRFRPTCPVVVPDLWQVEAAGPPEAFTTIGNWRQLHRDLVFRGETYTWSKHHEFLKFIDLPRRTDQPFELALSSRHFEDEDRRLLAENGWRVRDAGPLSADLDVYRNYVAGSRGEFTAAKDANIRLRSGWFSERSAQYLAAGRPVITQDTGFGIALPTGRGLFAFSTTDQILDAVARVNADYGRHCRAAAGIAREFFASDVVLPRMLAEVGL